MFGRRECEWAYGLDVKEKVLEDGPKRPRGSIAKGSRIMFWSRMLPMTVSPMVVMPVLGWFCCSSELLFFLCGSHPDILIPRKCRDNVKLDRTKKTCEARLQKKAHDSGKPKDLSLN